MSWNKSGILAAILVAATMLGACSDSSGPGNGGTPGAITVPASWGGTWQVSSTPSTPLAGGGSDVSVDPLCAGLSVEELFGDFGDEFGIPIDLSCSGSWNDGRADVTCTASGTVEGCEVTVTITLDVTRSGDTFAGTQTLTLEAGPPCDETLSESSDIMGQRLDTDQFGCGENLVDEVPSDWGGTWVVADSMTTLGGGGTLICPGWSPEYLFWPFVGGVEVTGGFDGNTAEVFGSWSVPAGSCTDIITEQVQVTRNGESFTGTRQRKTYTVPNPSLRGECTGTVQNNYNTTGTRTSSDVSKCGFGRLPEMSDLELGELDLNDFRLW